MSSLAIIKNKNMQLCIANEFKNNFYRFIAEIKN